MTHVINQNAEGVESACVLCAEIKDAEIGRRNKKWLGEDYKWLSTLLECSANHQVLYYCTRHSREFLIFLKYKIQIKKEDYAYFSIRLTKKQTTRHALCSHEVRAIQTNQKARFKIDIFDDLLLYVSWCGFIEVIQWLQRICQRGVYQGL